MRPTTLPCDPRAIAALTVGTLGAVDLSIGILDPRLAPALFLPLKRLGDVSAAAACGLALIILAGGLRRGLRPAWVLAVLLLAQAALASPVNHGALALLPLVPLAFLVRHYARFSVRARAPWRGYAAILAITLVLMVPVRGIPLRHARGVFAHVARAESAHTHARAVHAALLHAPSFWPLVPLTGVITLALLWGLCGLTLPALPGRREEDQKRACARRLFAEHGGNPVGYFAAVGDKALWADSQGRGVVAYRVIGATALVVGDPLATPDDLPSVLDGFLNDCRAHGWTPAFYQAVPATLPLYRARGFSSFAIGREAIVDLPAFTLTGKRIANVRHSVTHAERAGLHVRLYGADELDVSIRAALADISREWLSSKGGGEMSFTMGQLGPDGAPTPGARVAIAYDADNRPQAFITLVPSGGGHGWTLDLMRRRHAAESGTMDLLIARTAEALRDEGYATLSLSLAPLACGTDDDEDAPALARRARAILYEKMDGAYNYRSLYAYKKKFNVSWETRYLVYAGTAALPSALYATARAHLPSRLIALPHLPGLHPVGRTRATDTPSTEAERRSA